MQINDTFTKEQYTQYAKWANKNNAKIVKLEDGKYQVVTIPEPPEPTYAEKRQKEYPSLQEQLDMIYWDKVNNTSVWQNTITNIKEKYPKEL